MAGEPERPPTEPGAAAGAAEGPPAEGAAVGATRPAPRRSRGGVSVVAGGLLQDLEDRLRRDLPPIEERVRPGEELRGLAGSAGGAGSAAAAGADGPLVIVLGPSPATERPAERG